MSDQESDPEFARWKWEQDRIIAERYHDRETQYAEWANKAAIDNANLTLRTLMVINGGAAIAVLAFVGTLVGGNTGEFVDDLERATAPLTWFAWGVALTTLGMGFAYITNYCITSSITFRQHNWQHPYVEETERSNRWAKWGIGFQIAAIVLAVKSLGCFLVGMYAVRTAIVFVP